MYINLGYHGVEYEKCERMRLFQGGSGYKCGGKLEWFTYYFSVIFA